MKIAIIVEGDTEKAFAPFLRNFLAPRLPGRMPDLDFLRSRGGIPTDARLRQTVDNLLNDRKSPADAVIALTDVYTGKNPPLFVDANDAK